MNVNETRIMERIEAFSKFNENPEFGISRFSYGKEDAEARKWLLQVCRELDLSISVDPVGNIRARYEGKDPTLAPIMIGSHMDSVRNGGKYDGIVGVVGALEVLSVMRDYEYQPKRAIELVVFAEEEGSNFGTTMVGSKALTGKLSLEEMEVLHTENGENAIEVLEKFGLHPADMDAYILKSTDVDAMLELHIEQGIVLEREKKRLGVVQAIAGMTTLEVTISGESNHAGATPMNMRSDPMSAAAILITKIEEVAAHQVLESTVATVGSISCKPNMPNVIPGEVVFTVDIRDIDAGAIQDTIQKIEKYAKIISEERGVQIAFRTIGTSSPIALSPRIKAVIEKAVAKCSDSWMKMNSGAVHDAAMMASVTDVGMIFVPSVRGKSHNKEEYTEASDITLGCQALLLSVCSLCE